MEGFKTYKIKHIIGSRGDQDDWDTRSEEEIQEEVKHLKESGLWGKEVEYTLHMKEYPLFDDIEPIKFTSFSTFLDLGNAIQSNKK